MPVRAPAAAVPAGNSVRQADSVRHGESPRRSRNAMEKFLIRNEFGQPQELLGEEIVIPDFEEFQFILHAWLYDKQGGWAVTERSSGKRITSGRAGTEHLAKEQLDRQLRLHGKEALLRVLGKGDLSS